MREKNNTGEHFYICMEPSFSFISQNLFCKYFKKHCFINRWNPMDGRI